MLKKKYYYANWPPWIRINQQITQFVNRNKGLFWVPILDPVLRHYETMETSSIIVNLDICRLKTFDIICLKIIRHQVNETFVCLYFSGTLKCADVDVVFFTDLIIKERGITLFLSFKSIIESHNICSDFDERYLMGLKAKLKPQTIN